MRKIDIIKVKMSKSAKIGRNTWFLLALVFMAFCCLSSLHAQTTQRSPIDVNLIIDGSNALSNSKGEISTWINDRLDQILINGDRVTVWNAGSTASVVYSGSINGDAERNAVKKSISDIQPSGNNADFSGALRDASSRSSSTFSYTLLITASPAALSSVLNGPQANLLRFSRIEEFSSWRAVVVGLNLDTRVKRAASAFPGS